MLGFQARRAEPGVDLHHAPHMGRFRWPPLVGKGLVKTPAFLHDQLLVAHLLSQAQGLAGQVRRSEPALPILRRRCQLFPAPVASANEWAAVAAYEAKERYERFRELRPGGGRYPCAIGGSHGRIGFAD